MGVCVCANVLEQRWWKSSFFLHFDSVAHAVYTISLTHWHTHTHSLCHAIRMWVCVCVCAYCVHKQTHVQFFVCQNIFHRFRGSEHTPVVVVILRISEQTSVQEGTRWMKIWMLFCYCRLACVSLVYSLNTIPNTVLWPMLWMEWTNLNGE